ncbi:Uncharacterized protein DAT39_005535, partial [Clarias magur]
GTRKLRFVNRRDALCHLRREGLRVACSAFPHACQPNHCGQEPPNFTESLFD